MTACPRCWNRRHCTIADRQPSSVRWMPTGDHRPGDHRWCPGQSPSRFPISRTALSSWIELKFFEVAAAPNHRRHHRPSTQPSAIHRCPDALNPTADSRAVPPPRSIRSAPSTIAPALPAANRGGLFTPPRRVDSPTAQTADMGAYTSCELPPGRPASDGRKWEMSSTTGSSATSADQRLPTHGTEAGRATTDRTGRCDLGCQASAAAGEPRLTRRRARPSLTRKSTPEAPNRIALTSSQFHR